MDAISALRIDAKNKTHTEKKKVSLIKEIPIYKRTIYLRVTWLFGGRIHASKPDWRNGRKAALMSVRFRFDRRGCSGDP